MTYVFNLVPEESTFIWGQLQVVVTKTFQNLLDPVQMFLKLFTYNDDVIKVNMTYSIVQAIQYLLHHALVGCRSIAQPKWEVFILVKRTYSKCSPLFVFLLQLDLVISTLLYEISELFLHQAILVSVV